MLKLRWRIPKLSAIAPSVIRPALFGEVVVVVAPVIGEGAAYVDADQIRGGHDCGDLVAHRNREFRYGPIAAPVTASTELAGSSTRPNTSQAATLEPLAPVQPVASECGRSDRVVQRHRRRGPLSLLIPPAPCAGLRNQVGYAASSSIRPRIFPKWRCVKWLSASWRMKYGACRFRRPPVLNGRCCELVSDQF